MAETRPPARRVLVVNPNSSGRTTDMMVAIAQASATPDVTVVGATATRAPMMIVTEAELAAAAHEVVEIGLASASGHDGMIVAAFGDPGLAALRARLPVPVVGICEASMLDAACHGRRFGVATTTPDLVPAIADRARALGLGGPFTGTRCTPGDPWAVVADADMLREALARAVGACIDLDGAEAVIVGGGPLGEAARDLRPMFRVPIVAPVPSAISRLCRLMVDQAASARSWS